jgi:hypothetical protein
LTPLPDVLLPAIMQESPRRGQRKPSGSPARDVPPFFSPIVRTAESEPEAGARCVVEWQSKNFREDDALTIGLT